MSNQDYHKKLIGKVANALGDLNSKAVYVGGAVVDLYADDPAAPDVRPTDDVDVTLEITSVGELEKLRQQLREKGFRRSPKDDVICRFRYEDITYVLDNRTDLIDEIARALVDVLSFLAGEFEEILSDAVIKEAIQANLEYSMQ